VSLRASLDTEARGAREKILTSTGDRTPFIQYVVRTILAELPQLVMQSFMFMKMIIGTLDV
jgi:hypothetical protein